VITLVRKTDPERRLVLSLLARSGGGLRVVEPTNTEPTPGMGQTVVRPDEQDLAPAVVTVHDPRTFRAVVRHGSIGLAQAYGARWWDADDLTAVIRHLIRLTAPVRRVVDATGRHLSPLLDVVGQLHRPSPADDRDNVRAHYDLPDDIFDAMLDDTMAYSCAVFEHPDATLGEAQRAKFDRICRKLGLGSDDHVVEIGTGWGGFAIHAARTYGCRVTTTTVSERQLVRATERVAQEGLSKQVTVLGEDYRNLTGRFDAVVSIEMVEAVDWRLHRTFLQTCRRLVRDDGRVALQAIVLDDASEPRARHHDDFIRSMIFPGSCIPSISRLIALAGEIGLRTVDLDDIGRHYARTLELWRTNLQTALAGGAGPGTDDQQRRLWLLYLAYCEAAFLERHVSDVQLVLAPGGWRGELRVRVP